MDIIDRLRTIMDPPNYETSLAFEAADEIERLRDVLEDLMAVQNGPPLTEFQSEWVDAMMRASDMLYNGTERKGDRRKETNT